jgi:DNA-binding LacI/PurR family transcriptional regulator
MGRRSLLLLLDEIGRGTRSTSHVTVPADLVVRASTGPAPGA